MSTETPRPYRSVVPYFSMLLLAFGIMLVIFGGMVDGNGSRQFGTIRPLISVVTIPVGIGLIIFGGMLRKHLKRTESQHMVQRPTAATEKSCARCKAPARSGAIFCRNCGQHL